MFLPSSSLAFETMSCFVLIEAWTRVFDAFVLFKCLHTCSDNMTVLGLYPLQPSDGVGGHEGAGQVVAVGPDVKTLAVGDRVVPCGSGMGTWRTFGTYDEKKWFKINEKIPPARCRDNARQPRYRNAGARHRMTCASPETSPALEYAQPHC